MCGWGVGDVDDRWRLPRRRTWRRCRAGTTRHGRRARGESEPLQGEAEDAAVLEEDTVRGAQIECGEAAADERPLRQEGVLRRRRRGSRVSQLRKS